MYSTHQPTLATRFARSTYVIRSETPLADDQMRLAAPSIFAMGKHVSRSDRYTYIPTIEVLRGLRKEGFEPFMVAQSKSRIAGKTDFTKHMIRMRHAAQATARPETNEIILINSHDGASSYQMLAGVFRFVCCNGLVVGTVANDIRIPHLCAVLDYAQRRCQAVARPGATRGHWSGRSLHIVKRPCKNLSNSSEARNRLSVVSGSSSRASAFSFIARLAST
jgi:hypothetical protein